MWLTNSLPGIYIVQTFLHAFIAILIIERALQIWDIKNPLTQFRYRLMTLILPTSLFPLYHLINPDRNSLFFREEKAILNMNRWLSAELWDVIPVSAIFLLIFVITSVIFIFQEVIPIMKDTFTKRGGGDYKDLPADEEIISMVEELSRSLGIKIPSVTILDDEYPMMFTTGSISHSIVLSSGMLKTLEREQLHSAIAHELAHIVRRSNATTWTIFILRILMFFNPIVLIVFRRIVQDDENICDDITVSLTEKPLILASTLKIFYSSQHENVSSIMNAVSSWKEGIENYSHNLLLKERISRLESGDIYYDDREFAWGRFLLTISVIVVLNYFVV